ncbi:MAG TPA: hypothetical protein VH814_06680 [Steroidobacteraceae bacterium]|jgi:hypothetical protein
MKLSASTRLYSLLLAAVLPLLDASAAGTPGVVEGTLTRINASEVQVDHDQVYLFDPARAHCFDFRGDALPCDTLIGIGYVDRARITLLGTAVQRIDILELQQ